MYRGILKKNTSRSYFHNQAEYLQVIMVDCPVLLSRFLLVWCVLLKDVTDFRSPSKWSMTLKRLEITGLVNYFIACLHLIWSETQNDGLPRKIVRTIIFIFIYNEKLTLNSLQRLSLITQIITSY